MAQTVGATVGPNIPWVAPGLIVETAQAGIVAGTTRTQAGATLLFAEINRVDTSTAPASGSLLGDGVKLPIAVPGLDITVHNNTANPIQIYPFFATDTINGVIGSAGVAIPPNSVELFECASIGTWAYDAGVGFTGQLNTVLALDNISAAGTSQQTATALVADFNRLTTVNAGTGVVMPPSAPGLDVIIVNHGNNSAQIYGNGSDNIDDVAGSAGVVQMPNSVVIYTCYASGNWYSEGLATGFVRGAGLQTLQYFDTVSAAGSGQSNGTPLTAMINRVSTGIANSGVNLPGSAGGLMITVINSTGNNIYVYPAQSASDTINGFAASGGILCQPNAIGTFFCTAAGAWWVQVATPALAAYNTNAATSGTTLTGANMVGGQAIVALAMTGSLGGAANAQLPTVAALVAATHSPSVNDSWVFRFINVGAGFTWTLTTNTGWTLNGTMTIATATWVDFVVTINSTTPTATIQRLGGGNIV